MANLESRVEKLESKIPTLEQQISIVSTKVDLFVEESRESRNRQDADMREIRQSIDSMGKHVRNVSAATIISIAAIVVAVLLK